MAPNLSPNLVRFGVFELDLRARELRKQGLSTGLPEQSIKILALLLEKPGDVVLREEIRRKLWPNDTVVEFDHSINAAIKRLRQVLGDPAEAPQYIETLARRGYRWKIPVDSVDPQPQNAERAEADDVQNRTATGGNLIGKKVSHYRVLEVLGGGGMGVVFKAEDLKLGRRVALKFLPQETANDPRTLQRFEQEARAASALSHPNICTIYEIEEHEKQPFIVMEFLEGETLREVISAAKPRTAPLPLEELLDLAVQIAQGLEAAHQRGIIHRDIKPANIVVTTQGQAKILDFGLAKLVLEFVAADAGSKIEHRPDNVHGTPEGTETVVGSDLSLTLSGVAMGTAGYMSPEQVRGEKLDSRTDLFSFGLVLYEMATGKRAFTGDTALVVQEAILHQMPSSPRGVNPGIPAQFEEIISKALEKDREARYQAASEMRSDLEALRQEIRSKSFAKWKQVAAAVVVVGIIVWATLWFAHRQSSLSQAVPDLKLRQLTTNFADNRVVSGAISPDGKYLAYADTRGMHIKIIETSEIRDVPQPDALQNRQVDWETSAWFPDGTRFLANAHPAGQDYSEWGSEDTSIWVFSLLGGAPRKIRDEAYVYSISRDGSTISFGTNNGKYGDREIWLMRPDGEQARKIYDTDENSSIGGLLWSPDGQRVLYARSDASGDSFVSRDLKGGPLTTFVLPLEVKGIIDYFWLPDGRLIYPVREPGVNDYTCNYWAMRLDPHTGEPVEKPRRLTNWTGSCLISTTATADGKRLAFLQWVDQRAGYVSDLEAGGARILNPRQFTSDVYDNAITDWTADSKMVVVVQNRLDHYMVYKQLLNGDTPEPIMTPAAGGLLQNAVLSPDGKWVIGLVYPIPGGSLAPRPLIRVPITGGSPQLIFKLPPQSGVFCARPPSNLCAVAESTEDGKQRIVTTFDPVKGRGAELARFEIDHSPKGDNSPLCNISPDGTRLAVSGGPKGPIQILSLRGQPTQVIRAKSLDDMQSLNWAADGKGLFISKGAKRGSELLHIDLKGNVGVLWNCSEGSCFAVPSPDGRRLAIHSEKRSTNMWMMENF